MTRRPGTLTLSLLLLLLAACSRPEATRTRGGGPGGDTGNRPPAVHMHEGSSPFHDTPRLMPAAPPALEPASQARQLSRR